MASVATAIPATMVKAASTTVNASYPLQTANGELFRIMFANEQSQPRERATIA